MNNRALPDLSKNKDLFIEKAAKEDVSDILIFWPSFIGKGEGLSINGQNICLSEIAS